MRKSAPHIRLAFRAVSVVFVTHSIEESVYLADRVVAMTYRPGTIKREVPVTLARERDPSSAKFNRYTRELAQLVMEEQYRHNQDEIRIAAAEPRRRRGS